LRLWPGRQSIIAAFLRDLLGTISTVTPCLHRRDT
jgi:hypothetical protein